MDENKVAELWRTLHQQDESAGTLGRRGMNWLAGRMGRRAFLGYYVCLTLSTAVLALATGNRYLADIVAIIPWIWISSRRLHDFNAHWWWSLAPAVIGFVSGFVRRIFANADAETLRDVGNAGAQPPNQGPVLEQNLWSFLVDFANGFLGTLAHAFAVRPIETALQLALLLVLGLWPGASGENRFGDPPGKKGTSSI